MCMIRKLGEDKKTNGPSHLAEIAHAYNATQSAVTTNSPHNLMFGWWPRLLVDFVFPTIGSNVDPMREASVRHVHEYAASIQDRLRTTLWEAQAQSMAEVCQQKWYYDREIGTVNLKPGDLILVKADAWKGKRKIRDKWCYVRQCSLFAYLILNSLYEMCLGLLHYISLYALSLHSTLAHLWVPFLHVLGRIRELALCNVINSNCYYI